MGYLSGNFREAVSDMVNSLTAADKVNIKNAIREGSMDASVITEKHTLVTDVRNGSRVPIVHAGDDYGALYGADENSCYKNSCDLSTKYSMKTWGLGRYNCRVEICMQSFDEDFNIFWNMYKKATNDPLGEPDESAFLEFLIEKAENRVRGAGWRVAYLGDTDSGNGLINRNDGFLTQADAGKGCKIDIKESSPTGEQIYQYLRQAYKEACGKRWFKKADVTFKMTDAMASELVMFFNTCSDLSKYNCGCIDPRSVVGSREFSVDNLKVFGIPVEAREEIDGSLEAVGDGRKHQALLTRKSNMLIGSTTEKSLSMFDIFYDRVSGYIFMDTELYMGASLPLDEYVYIRNN